MFMSGMVPNGSPPEISRVLPEAKGKKELTVPKVILAIRELLVIKAKPVLKVRKVLTVRRAPLAIKVLPEIKERKVRKELTG